MSLPSQQGRLSGKTVLIANPSPDVYGSDLQMLESISGLRGAGARVIVAMPRDGALTRMIRERGGEVRFVSFPVLRRANQSVGGFARMIWDALIAVPRLSAYIRRRKPSAVYVNTVTLPWWVLAARLAGSRTIVHLHEAEDTDSGLVRRALVSPLRLAHAVIVISRSAMRAMVDADPSLAAKAHLIYNGVPEPTDAPEPPTRQAPLGLLVIGRLSPRKAPHLALEAAGRLRQQGYDVVVELAGTAFPGYEWYVEELEARAARDDLEGAVRFAGYCKPIWPNLARADIVVAPSLREPFGNAVVEAQLALRPVVATAALGHTESIMDGETGILVPAEDVDAMVEAIARLAEDAELANRIATAARTEAVNRFGVERYYREVVDLVSSLTNRGAE